ncbi:prolipoprotein diacylglyceryl transferase [Aeromicrobium marinum DSM 15272]|uniref:Phosphatidylglycerol--prolipoprotein diacylglyceryl transferase n=1 Tax=Aeromicrobium marinum DSM 15272 TaxID=585531 RepID=E2S924_9ACTN|nr:prolipoprotein diacylglyceryl transferase [Aeromicrobium marinum]EFQ84294.1 prolipoprotein diacylglyceryl transferase [Aeromicrobium marinum DSM 15272]
MTPQTLVQSIPSPSSGVWEIGPFPLRAYALGIIIGALLAIWIGERRFQARGGKDGVISDVAIWAIPFGIVGARIYHVATDPQLYFGDGQSAVDALKIWQGGLGIWGAVAGGALGAYIAARRAGVSFAAVADAIAPGLLVAQAVGRLGNYFNQELFGRPTELPWALEIDPENRPAGFLEFATFHPTFLYELLWNLAAALLLVLIDRRVRLTGGRAFALYVMFYTAGRFWIEMLRIDTVNEIGPFRLNVWTSIVVFVLAAAFFWWSRRRGAPVDRSEPSTTPAD